MLWHGKGCGTLEGGVTGISTSLKHSKFVRGGSTEEIIIWPNHTQHHKMSNRKFKLKKKEQFTCLCCQQNKSMKDLYY